MLRNIYGGTEFGSPGYSSRRPGDEIEWEYFEFSQDSEVVWVAQGDKTFECQLFVCFFSFLLLLCQLHRVNMTCCYRLHLLILSLFTIYRTEKDLPRRIYSGGTLPKSIYGRCASPIHVWS